MSEPKCATCFDSGSYAVESWYEDTYNYCKCPAGIALRKKDDRARAIRLGQHLPFHTDKAEAIKDAQEAADCNRQPYRVYWNSLIMRWGARREDDNSYIFDRPSDTVIYPKELQE